MQADEIKKRAAGHKIINVKNIFIDFSGVLW